MKHKIYSSRKRRSLTKKIISEQFFKRKDEKCERLIKQSKNQDFFQGMDNNERNERNKYVNCINFNSDILCVILSRIK